MHDTLIFFFAWLFAGFVNNIVGFGAAMVAMPFIAVLVPLEIAVPASTLIVLTLNLQVGWNYRQFIKWKRLGYLFVGGVAGTAAGIPLMQAADNNTLKLGMGIFMVAYACYSLLGRKNKKTGIGLGWGVPAGFASTVCGALFGFNGPPLAMYISRTGWSQEEAKGLFGACFIMTGVTILTGQLVAGIHNVQTLHCYAAGMPGALIGGATGIFISRFLPQRVYSMIVLLLIAASGTHTMFSCF